MHGLLESLRRGMRRAAPEIYMNLRNQGSDTVREWLSQSYVGSRAQNPEWTSLWALAVQIDYELGEVKDAAQLLNLLGTSDTLEISLRHLSAFIYEKRTSDRAGAAHMRAITAPGSLVDIGPGWLVDSATTHSKTEHKRDELVRGDVRARRKGEKGGGKGKKGGDGKGKAAAA